jgi:MarR family 2-MHQ and catechol resistance regulon transcriptional repressor
MIVSVLEEMTVDGMAVWVGVVRTHQAVDRFGRLCLEPLGLSLTDFVVLESLMHAGSMTPSQLSERVGLTRGSITSAVDRLSARGLATREPNEGDGRSSLVTLTTSGAEAIETAWSDHSDEVGELIHSALSPEESVVLLRLLGRVRRAAKRESAHRFGR